MATQDRLIQAVHRAARKLASSEKFDLLLRDVLAICVDAVGATGGTIYLHDPQHHRLRFQHVLPEDIEDKLPSHDMAEDFGMAGEAFMSRQTVYRDFPLRPEVQRNAFEQATGVVVHNMIATPLMMEDETPIGVVQLLNKVDGSFNESDIAVLDTIAAVATMAYANSKLTEESIRASSLLGMGKVSHDIGNLAASLYAYLNISDVTIKSTKKELSSGHPDKAGPYVQELDSLTADLRYSVDRIVGYSRLISDLAAGRPLRPTMVLAPLTETIRNSAAYIEADARANHVALTYDLDDNAPPTMHDELYVFRIVQNLVGNAVRAVKDTIPEHKLDSPRVGEMFGVVKVSYHFDGKTHVIEVSDTGPGMSKDTIERILSGNARSAWFRTSGSGWGTKIVLELASTHDATVSIDSVIGAGSVFRVSLPHRAP